MPDLVLLCIFLCFLQCQDKSFYTHLGTPSGMGHHLEELLYIRSGILMARKIPFYLVACRGVVWLSFDPLFSKIKLFFGEGLLRNWLNHSAEIKNN